MGRTTTPCRADDLPRSMREPRIWCRRAGLGEAIRAAIRRALVAAHAILPTAPGSRGIQAWKIILLLRPVVGL